MCITIISVMASKAPRTALRALSGALFCTTPINPGVKPEFAKVTQVSHRERLEHKGAPSTKDPWSNPLSIFLWVGMLGPEASIRILTVNLQLVVLVVCWCEGADLLPWRLSANACSNQGASSSGPRLPGLSSGSPE